MPKDDLLAQRALQNSGQGNYGSEIESNRIIYPAIVVPYGTNDNSEQNRIRARIVSLEDDGKIKGKSSSANEENYNNYSGKDRGITDNMLVLCVPLLPEFFHVRPQVGEMVFVIMENPKNNTGVRYWIGPIVSSKLKLKYQSYEDSAKIFNKTNFISTTKIGSSIELSKVFPEDSDVAIQGRNDADLILKNREALLIAGKFSSQNFDINIECPSYLKLKQFDNTNTEIISTVTSTNIINSINVDIKIDTNSRFAGTIIIKEVKNNFELKNETNTYINRDQTVVWLNEKIKEAKEKYKNWSFASTTEEFKNLPANYNIISTPSITAPPLIDNQNLLKKYSQATLISTNINIYSPRGKFRGDDIKPFEKNADLKSFEKISDSLHPVTFGDENIRVLDLIIRLLLDHIHTPEKPLLQTSLSEELKKYTVDGWLQNLISNHIRVN
jgi:hypothetical protein